VVIRLRNVDTGRYVRRTVEIEKARGQSHRRGQHPYVIRDGGGSKTGEQINADDPEVFLGNPHALQQQSYVHIFPSLDFNSREIMRDPYSPPHSAQTNRFAAFGLPYLDNMLGGEGDKAERVRDGESDTRGLDCGKATALLGDSLTQKSRLGKAFLSRTFYSFVEDLKRETSRQSSRRAARELIKQVEDGIRDVAFKKTDATVIAKQIIKSVIGEVDRVRRRLTENSSKLYPVAVLFTTHDENVEDLANEFYQWLREEDGLGRDSTPEESPERRSDDDTETVGAVFVPRVKNEIRVFAREYRKYVINAKWPESRFRAGKNYKDLRNRFKRDLIGMVLETAVKTHIAEHTICRSFEIHDLPAPVLMNIFQRSIEKALRKMFRVTGDKGLPERSTCLRESWRIRVVVDDLNAFRNTYPDIREDPLMLPSLLFMFGREGVTSLIVDTQASGSPDLPITERFDSSIRQLVETRLYIWRLPFYGENRIAITVIPPKSHEYRGLIRELRWDMTSENNRALTVDPHFELYTGLEKAQPQPVPLEVRLYSDTESMARYISTEERILREVFTPVLRPNSQPLVILPAQRHEYEPLRDACHIQRDTRLDHTTILQVNEFWWLRRPKQRRTGAFRTQWSYLNSVTATFRDKRFSTDPVADPFSVFQPTPAEEVVAEAKQKASHKDEHATNNLQVKRKRDFFDEECGYGLQALQDAEKDYLDRVPYTWDFGFLLCNGKAWEETGQQSADENGGARLRQGQTVAEVWEDLCRRTTDDSTGTEVSWRTFLEASKLVAEFQSFRTSARSNAFDFTMLIPESFSCLILEMWLSESYSSLRKYQKRFSIGPTSHNFNNLVDMLKEVGNRHWYSGTKSQLTLLKNLQDERNLSLQEILELRRAGTFKCFSLELYKVWLLLTEAINFEDLVDSSSHLNFEFKSKDVTANAVSARHWYKTASAFMDSLTPEQVEYNWLPVRLPGHFSVRADWFLAVAGGSRSSRVADHALDLLSSQRANVTRLQEGIGLPTRRLFDGANKQSHLRTRLISAPKGEALKNVEYESLRRIGAQIPSAENEHFFWLWRSGIWAYNRHSRIWHKWLNRALLWWHARHQRYGSSWTTGFEVYDLLNDIEFENGKVREESCERFESLNLDSWNRFRELRNILISELEQVSISTV
jgi:hypothetical protein